MSIIYKLNVTSPITLVILNYSPALEFIGYLPGESCQASVSICRPPLSPIKVAGLGTIKSVPKGGEEVRFSASPRYNWPQLTSWHFLNLGQLC